MSEDRDDTIDRLKDSVDKPEKPSGRMSLEEVREAIEEVARDTNDRERFKALKMLASMDAAGAVLPAPLGNGEVIEMLSRVMKPAGPDLCQVAYRRAFPQKRDNVGDSPEIYMDDLSTEDIKLIDSIRSLKTLYRKFPTLKGPGCPKGFPMTGSLVMKAEWCRRAAARIILEQRSKEAEGGKVQEVPNDAA